MAIDNLSVSIPRELRLEVNESPATPATPDDAAVTMQKLYRGYRTRRQLADCAVIARKYDWWNVLEGVTLRHNSEDFYDEKNQHVIGIKSKWTRLKNKAAKLGRGLAKDENARELAFQHWLEAIDARHRYGHNLHYYYVAWSKTSTQEPFFYWLDVGEGRNLDLKELPRTKLNKDQINYLGPRERKYYEVCIKNGIWMYKRRREIIDTTSEGRWIFVMSPSGSIYVGKKQKGKFQHSSFLAGGAAKAAGRLSIKEGALQVLEPHSGHYRPTAENFQRFLNILEEKGIDLAAVQVQFASHEMSRAHMKSLKSLSAENGESMESRDNVTTDETTTDGLSLADDLAMQQTGEVNEMLQEVVDALTPRSRGEEQAKPSFEQGPSPKVEQGPSPKVEQEVRGNIFRRFRPSKLSLQRQSSVGWCSGAGCRLSSLSIIPPSVRTRALDVMHTPRVQATVRW